MTFRTLDRASLATLTLLVLGAGSLAGCSSSDDGGVDAQPRTFSYVVSVVDVEIVRTVDGGAVNVDMPLAVSHVEVEP